MQIIHFDKTYKILQNSISKPPQSDIQETLLMGKMQAPNSRYRNVKLCAFDQRDKYIHQIESGIEVDFFVPKAPTQEL